MTISIIYLVVALKYRSPKKKDLKGAYIQIQHYNTATSTYKLGEENGASVANFNNIPTLFSFETNQFSFYR